MDFFSYQAGEAFCEEIPLNELAKQYGTPLYVYSKSCIDKHVAEFRAAFSELSPIIRFAVKSCSNIRILETMSQLGCGMDIVSGGELYRALSAGVKGENIVYAGVGKTTKEIKEALDNNVSWFNVESEAELNNIIEISASLNKKPNVAIRVNPDVSDNRTPEKTITAKKGGKFGIDMEVAKNLFYIHRDSTSISLRGLHIHLGSPIHEPLAYAKAIQKLLDLVEELKVQDVFINMIDVGGGFPATYKTSEAKSWQEYAEKIVPLLLPFVKNGGEVVFEPGRTLIANSSVFLSEVLYIKPAGNKSIVIVDGGMTQMMRPALYDAFHFIWPISTAEKHVPSVREQDMENYMENLVKIDIAGPVCESTDFFAKDRFLPKLEKGDRICLFGAGAYGFALSSNYNSIPRPAEVLVRGDIAQLIRRRETYDDLIREELSL